ncbi:MAG: agmatinase [Dehalococcoidia bacterium]|nr:agmatinase [Dehalococcoidia bacterium]
MTSPRLPPEVFTPSNFLALEPDQSSFDTSRVVLLPVPYDSASSFRSGAREGPRAIIEASRHLEDFDDELKLEPCTAGIHTLPELEMHAGSPKAMSQRVTRVITPLADAGKLVGTLGGDHSLTAGAAEAFRRKYPDLSVLYLDAHADLRDSYQGSRYSHACSARRIHEHSPLVLAGQRSLCTEEWEYIQARRIPFYPWTEPQNIETAAKAIRQRLSQHVYISIDLDVLDPALMPAVGTPEPGGMTWHEMLTILRTVAASKTIVGFDVMELAPWAGPPACAYTAAKLVYKLIGYALFGKPAR